MNTNTSSSTSSSSSSQKVPQRPVDIHASHFHQFQNIRYRFEQMTSGASTSSTNNVRRYTSENNLNEINSPSKAVLPQKISRPTPLQTIATSTEDLTTIPSWKKTLSTSTSFQPLLDKTNHPSAAPLLTSNGTSASLIDLTSIDKIPTNKPTQPPPPSARPRFRFVPPSDKNSILKEEPELEQQSNQTYDNFDLKALSPNRSILPSKSLSSLHQSSKDHRLFFSLDNLIKPTVIHPTRSTLFHSARNSSSSSEWKQCIQTTRLSSNQSS